MSNFGQMVQDVADHAGQSSAGRAGHYIRMSIIDSILENRNREFEFNVSAYSFNTVVDQAEYSRTPGELPSDWLRPLDRVWITDADQRHLIAPVDTETLDRYKSSYKDSGRPEFLSFFNKKMIFVPAPDAIYAVDGRYVVDYDIPTATFDNMAGTWSYSADSFGSGNPWFTPEVGYEIIRSSALVHLANGGLLDVQKSRALYAIKNEQVAAKTLEAKHNEIPAKIDAWW